VNDVVYYTWDDNGNLTNDGVHSYTYDAANRLTAVSGSPASSFGYDGLGNRISMTVGATTTHYALDVAGGLPEVIAATNGASTKYLQVQGQIMAQYDSGKWAYVAPDALGSVRQLSDASGRETLAQSYDPFGNPLTSQGRGSSAFGYTGEQMDTSTGLVYLRARYYSSYLNRFVSPDTIIPDPAQPQKWNLYTYVLNNPANRTDPSGLCEAEDWECWAVYNQIVQEFPSLPVEFEKMYITPLHELPTDILKGLLEEPNAEIIARGSPSNVLGLIRLFEADYFPGKDAKERLRWILNQTGSPRFLSMQFGLFQADATGFCQELSDAPFYQAKEIWGRYVGPDTAQMGHFLTAISLGFDPETAYYTAPIFDAYRVLSTPYIMSGNPPVPTPEEHALNLIVGHEMVGDRPGPGMAISIPEQYAVATAEARELFLKAVEADRWGRYGERDEYLRPILGDPLRREAIPGNRRLGNSMPDLRLSVKGWRFGQEIRNGYGPDGPIQTRQQAADWLRRQVYDPSSTRTR
jgi:RHS repeat-associated protein